MPETKEPQILDTVWPEEEPWKIGGQPVSDSYALALVLGDYARAKNFRSNHEQRWTAADSLYAASCPQRFWEGTTVKRSALGIPLVAIHADTIQSKIIAALTVPDSYQYVPSLGATVYDARKIEDWMRQVLFDSHFEEELTLCVGQFLRYGNGGMEWYFDAVENTLRLRFVDIRDFYFDPLSGPSIQKARYVIRSSYLTIEELDRYRGLPGWRIPEREVLLALAASPASTAGDALLADQQTLMGANFQRTVEAGRVTSPEHKGIDVLCYYTKERHIWVLNQKLVIYNGRNPYGVYPFMFAPCYLEAGSPYAWSIADRIGNFQLYIQALYNLNLDGKHIQLQQPLAVQRAAGQPGEVGRIFPGQMLKISEKDTITPIQVSLDLARIADELQYAELMAERATGANSMAQGIPRPANANRTLGGIQEQIQSSVDRISTLVKNLEMFLIEPMLNIGLEIGRYHLAQEPRMITLLTPNMQVAYEISQSLLKPGRFMGRAASQMMHKGEIGQMLQFLLPQLAQGPVISALADMGMKVNWAGVWDLLMQATGLDRRAELVVPMTPEERQMMFQQQQEEQQRRQELEMQKAMLERDTRLKMGEMSMRKVELQQTLGRERDREKLQVQQALQREKLDSAEQIQTLKAIADEIREKLKINSRRTVP